MHTIRIVKETEVKVAHKGSKRGRERGSKSGAKGSSKVTLKGSKSGAKRSSQVVALWIFDVSFLAD